jgi:hypothetical protein
LHLGLGDRAEVAWLRDGIALHVRGQQVLAASSPHSLHHKLLSDAGPNTALDLKNVLDVPIRLLSIDGHEPRPERLAQPWLIRPGDFVILISPSMGRRITDDEVVNLAGAGDAFTASRRLVEYVCASHASVPPSLVAVSLVV